MAWNQTTVFLLAPGWQPVIQAAPGTKTSVGGPVRILHQEREGSRGAALRPEVLSAWLEARGFTRQHCWTLEDVEASVQDERGEVSGMTLRFNLSRESPSRWPAWQELVSRLCETWQLRLVDTDQATTVGAADLFRLLSGTLAWKEFSTHFHWPSLQSHAPADVVVQN